MAGDWTKVENATPDKPEIFRMAEMLKTDPDAVIGKVLRFWIWAGDHTTDGVLTAPVSLIDRLTHQPGFSAALREVGWLQARSNGSFAIPQFTRHNGQSAKVRAESNRRVSEHRRRDNETVKQNGNGHVTQKPLQKPLPEKRREENILGLAYANPAEGAAKPRQRDPLFDALAIATGEQPDQLTKTAGRAIGVALAEIRKATPDVTPEEIQRRAGNYRQHMPQATLTANALKGHWGRCASAPQTNANNRTGSGRDFAAANHSQYANVTEKL